MDNVTAHVHVVLTVVLQRSLSYTISWSTQQLSLYCIAPVNKTISCCILAAAASPTPASPSSKNGRKGPLKTAPTELEGGWDLFYKTGPSKPKVKRNSMVVPKVVTDISPKSKRNSLVPSSKDSAEK